MPVWATHLPRSFPRPASFALFLFSYKDTRLLVFSDLVLLASGLQISSAPPYLSIARAHPNSPRSSLTDRSNSLPISIFVYVVAVCPWQGKPCRQQGQAHPPLPGE